MLLDIKNHTSGTTSPCVPPSNDVQVPNSNLASITSVRISRLRACRGLGQLSCDTVRYVEQVPSRNNEELSNMPYLRHPPGLFPCPNEVPPTKLGGNFVSRLRNARGLGQLSCDTVRYVEQVPLRNNEELSNMPYLRYPPGLVSTPRMELRNKGEKILSAMELSKQNHR